MCAGRENGEKSDHGRVMRELHEGVLLGKVLEGKVTASVVEQERCERTAYVVHWDVACLCGLKDLSDAWVGLQVLRGICMSRRSKGQERIHVCELERAVKKGGEGLRGEGAYVE
jgi:hypothetical protein